MKLYLFLAVLLLVFQPSLILLSIDSSGVVEADLKIMASEGLNEIKLPAEPIPETIEVMMDGKPLIPIYENGSLYFLSPISGEAEISYLVNVSARDHVFGFRILGENLTSLRLASQVILLTIPEKIENLEYVDGDLLIKFYGPEKIEYAVKKPLTEVQENITTTTLSTSTEKAETITYETFTSSIESTRTAVSKETSSSWATSMSQGRAEVAVNYYDLIAAVIIIVPAVALSAILLSRRRPKVDRSLSNVDRMILEKIREAGGSILQGDLQNKLGIPKTTLWRHARKLEKLGYVRIVKEGPFNRLILSRDFR